MLQKTPKEKLVIPDTCSRIMINIKGHVSEQFLGHIKRVSLRRLFKGSATVDMRRPVSNEHNETQIEINRNPQIPLNDAEKEFLENMSKLNGIEVLFY